MIVWTLWHRRNPIKLGSHPFPLDRVLIQAHQYLQDFYWVQPVKPS